jgi:TonB C terminal
LPVTLISPDPLPHIEIPTDRVDVNAEAAAKVDSGDPAGRALLFGRYSGQIQARIERAWLRPRSQISSDLDSSTNPIATAATRDNLAAAQEFRCQVRILQEAHGAVREVQMLSCNGSITWQQSLVRAILSASPLPAPPDPAVFTKSLTMTFEGQAYTPGDSTDGYEVEPVSTASISGPSR